MATDTASVLARLKAKEDTNDLLEQGLILVGQSMGAKAALATLGIPSPDLLSLVRGLVFIAPAPPTTLELPPEMKAQRQVAYELEESVRWTAENVLANTEKLTPSDIELVVRGSFEMHGSYVYSCSSHRSDANVDIPLYSTHLSSCQVFIPNAKARHTLTIPNPADPKVYPSKPAA